jgi:hypothetical protein
MFDLFEKIVTAAGQITVGIGAKILLELRLL